MYSMTRCGPTFCTAAPMPPTRKWSGRPKPSPPTNSSAPFPKGTTLASASGRLIGPAVRDADRAPAAVLRDPDLLLLDEATNALDAITEAEFQVALKKFASNRAVVVVAHKLSTVEVADHVIVLQNGRIAEQGHPAVLAQADGLFADMFSAAAPQQLKRSHAVGARATSNSSTSGRDPSGQTRRSRARRSIFAPSWADDATGNS